MNDLCSASTASFTLCEWALRALPMTFYTRVERAWRSSYLLAALSKSATMLSLSETEAAGSA